jgi:hypothetical protein
VLALGAMLPDFAAMLRERIATLEHPALLSGAKLHAATDAAFHASPEFVALQSAGSARLRAEGVSRGPARAAAHVGIELLVDLSLAATPGAARDYAEALRAAALPEVDAAIAWRRADAAPRWRRLQARLLARGAPEPGARGETIAARVARALSTRPRLALDRAAQRAVAHWLGEASGAVAEATPALFARVIAATDGVVRL